MEWYKSGWLRDLVKVLWYYFKRIRMNIEIFEVNELIF